jgi:phosphatidate phosphatase APP1
MVIIEPYLGFIGRHRYFIQGRVLRDRGIRLTPGKTSWQNLKKSIKRFGSKEIPGVRIKVRFGQDEFEVISDHEGYFTIDRAVQSTLDRDQHRWHEITFSFLDAGSEFPLDKVFTGKLLSPDQKASFGVISDIDDTILKTDVTSLLKIRMLVNTLLKSARQRQSVEGMSDLLKFLCWKDPQIENPVWYVSNSPWNVYDLLQDFLALQEFPRGPVMLRDYGMHLLRNKPMEQKHKYRTLETIFRLNQDLGFILIGDNTSNDVDFYLRAAREFPKQVKAVYIRKVSYGKSVQRIQSLFNEIEGLRTLLFKDPREVIRDVSDHFWQ